MSEDFRSQATTKPSLQEFLRARRHGTVHPMARLAFLAAFELDVLKLESVSHPFLKVDAAHNEISAEY